jgi:hypothetical protein
LGNVIFFIKKEYVVIETSDFPEDNCREKHEATIDLGYFEQRVVRRILPTGIFLGEILLKQAVPQQTPPKAQGMLERRLQLMLEIILLWCDASYIGMIFEVSTEGRDAVFIQFYITVQKTKVFPRGKVGSHHVPATEAEILFIPDNRVSGAKLLFQQLEVFFLAVVVYDDDFIVSFSIKLNNRVDTVKSIDSCIII